MKVNVTIEREDGDELGETMSMGVSAAGLEPNDVCKLLLAGAEMVVYDMVRDSLEQNGGDPAAVSYAAPLRTRLYVIETMLAQEPTPYDWVHLDLSTDLSGD